MATVAKTAGVAGSVTLTTRNTAGQALTPVSVPVVKWYTDAARTAGEVTLTTTGSGSTYTASWTTAQAPTATTTRYLKVTIEVATGTFDTDADDDIAFVDAISSIEAGYFTLAEARATDSAFVSYTDAEIGRVRDEVEAAIEAACGVAFVPRTATERLSGTGGRGLHLARYPLRSVTAVRVHTGATFSDYTAAELADLIYDDIGVVYRYSLGHFAYGRHNIEVTYTHGYDSPAAAPMGHLIRRAALLLFRYWMRADKAASVDPGLMGVRSLSVEGYSVSYGDTGANGGFSTGVPDVDRLIAQWKGRDGVVIA